MLYKYTPRLKPGHHLINTHKPPLELCKRLPCYTTYCSKNCTSVHTMEYSLFLLAIVAMAMVGTVRGAELGARIEGVALSGPFCTAEQEYKLYQECVEQVFFDMGGELDRRLELRGGGRKLFSCAKCSDKAKGSQGHYCFTYCGEGRTLNVADKQAHTKRFLVSKGQLKQEAKESLENKITNGYECLGDPEDLRIKIFLSE
jgi:hypothetical protein